MLSSPAPPAALVPVTLDPVDYWELQATLERVRALELEAQALQTRLIAAQEKRTTLLARLADRYGVDPTQPYRLDEATHSLHPMR